MLACYFPVPLFTDWAPDCYVRCGCIGSPAFLFSSGWEGGRGPGGACPLVLCSLLLLPVLDVQYFLPIVSFFNPLLVH